MKFLLAIPAGLYGLGLRLRHWLFDRDIRSVYTPDIPVICVGNITVGGTGKTPVVEYLVNNLSGKYKIAVLSRGYGRRTKGYLEVSPDAHYRDVGDEPCQIKEKFPGMVVVVCEDRKRGIERIRLEHPEVDLIVMDDGFQHRRVKPKLNIVLADYNRPMWEDKLLPWGRLRDLPVQIRRADIVLVTKAPASLSPLDRRLTGKSLRLYPYQTLFFTSMVQGDPEPVFPDEPGLVTPAATNGANGNGCDNKEKAGIAVMSGIGNPKAMTESLEERYRVVAKFIFPDHHPYGEKDLLRIAEWLDSSPDTALITTEKDAVKLRNGLDGSDGAKHGEIPETIRRRLYTIPVAVAFDGDDEAKFLKTLYKNVKED